MKSKFLLGTVVLALLVFGVAPRPALAANCTSTGSGNWSAPGTWTNCDGLVPQAADDVTIANGHTVIVDVNTNNLNSLTVNGLLTVGNDSTARNVAVSGNVTVASGGSIAASTTPATHNMTIGGNLVNSGTFDGLPGANRIINVTFNNMASDQTISGISPITTRFNKITLDKSVSTRKVIASIDVTVAGSTDSFTWTNGTWEQSSNRLTITGGNQRLTANGGLILSGSGSATFPNSITDGTTTGGLLGTLVVNTTGDLTLGTGNNRLQVGNASTPGVATFTGGTVNVKGRLTLTIGTVTINGATVNIDPQATNALAGTSNVLEAAGAVNITMSSGSIVIVDPLSATGAGREISLSSGTGTKTFSGGTIYLGDGTSNTPGSTDGFEVVTSGITLNSFVVRNQQGGNNRTVNLGNVQGTPTASDLNLNGDLTIETGGTLNANVGMGSNITLKGNWSNGGTFTPGTGTVTFNGTATSSTVQTFTGSTAFNNLTIAAGAVVETNAPVMTVNGTYTNNGRLRHTPTAAVTGCDTGTISEKDATNNNTVSLSNCSGLTGATIKSSAGYGFPNIDLGTSLKYDTCPASSNLINRYWQITPNGTGTAAVDFIYRTAEQNGNTGSLFLYKCVSGAWQQEVILALPQNDAGILGYKFVSVTNLSLGSAYALGSSAPTAVRLSSFDARTEKSLEPILLTALGISLVVGTGFVMLRRRRR